MVWPLTRFAKVLSHALSPFASSAWAIVVIALNRYPDVRGVLYFLAGVTLTSIIPFLFIFSYARRENVEVEIPDRGARPSLFTPVFAGYAASGILFYTLNFRDMLLLSLSYVEVSFLILLVTFKWKISVHTAGLTVPVTALTYIFGWKTAWIYPLVGLLIWARVKLKAHSLPQAVSGAAIGVALTSATFILAR
ncbi:MAG: hypothetical protein QXO32_00605 [Candidatus Bathyarchaeia archaeon]